MKKLLALALLLALVAGCCTINKEAVKSATDTEIDLMTELAAYVSADPKKSDDLKAAEAAKIRAHLDLINALRK